MDHARYRSNPRSRTLDISHPCPPHTRHWTSASGTSRTTDRIDPKNTRKLVGAITASQCVIGSPTRARTWDLRINSGCYRRPVRRCLRLVPCKIKRLTAVDRSRPHPAAPFIAIKSAIKCGVPPPYQGRRHRRKRRPLPALRRTTCSNVVRITPAAVVRPSCGATKSAPPKRASTPWFGRRCMAPDRLGCHHRDPSLHTEPPPRRKTAPGHADATAIDLGNQAAGNVVQARADSTGSGTCPPPDAASRGNRWRIRQRISTASASAAGPRSQR